MADISSVPSHITRHTLLSRRRSSVGHPAISSDLVNFASAPPISNIGSRTFKHGEINAAVLIYCMVLLLSWHVVPRTSVFRQTVVRLEDLGEMRG